MLSRRKVLVGAGAVAVAASVPAVAMAAVEAAPKAEFNNTIFYVGVNHRGSYKWVAPPGHELISPHGKISGIMIVGMPGGRQSQEFSILRQKDGTLHVESEGVWSVSTEERMYLGMGSQSLGGTAYLKKDPP